VESASASQWVTQLAAVNCEDHLEKNLRQLQRTPLIINEARHILFGARAASLFFRLISSRYERRSVIVTSNRAFTAWGDIFGGAVVAAAMIGRLLHHAEIKSPKGDSYHLYDKKPFDSGTRTTG